MAEQHQRCRHWPECQVHIGYQLRSSTGGRWPFSADNRAEMVELYLDYGWTYAEIAEDFGTWPQVVGNILAEELGTTHTRAYRKELRRAQAEGRADLLVAA